jgi:hypothetical protein
MRVFHVGGSLEYDEEGRPGTFHWEPVQDPDHAGDACNPLFFPKDLAHAVITSSDPFFCCNCLANRQYCYECKGMATPEQPVIRCVAASCGKFYHSECVRAKGKGKGSAGAAAADALLCPQHSCAECGGEGESKELGELVPCRRCPRAYHEGCIPPRMYSDEQAQRVWLFKVDEEGNPLPGVQVDRSLLYCMRHKADGGAFSAQGRTYDDEMWEEWQLHYARQYAHLESSKTVLKARLDAAAAKPPPLRGKLPAKRPVPLPKEAKAKGVGEVGPPAASRRRVEDLFDAARREVFKEDVRAATRQPVPYDIPMRKTVDEVSLSAPIRKGVFRFCFHIVSPIRH